MLFSTLNKNMLTPGMLQVNWIIIGEERRTYTWVKVQNFQNPELLKFNF